MSETDFPPFETKLKRMPIGKTYKLLDVFNRLVEQGDFEPDKLAYFIVWTWSKGRPLKPEYELDMPANTAPEHWTITRIN